MNNPASKEVFAGDRKVGQSILTPLENRLKNWLVPRVPMAVETWHLTFTTVLWSAGVLVFGKLASSDLRWLWGISLMIVLQYLTDLADGEVGRQRNTGLIKWGFYMDHFLDYIFLCCLVMAGYLIAPVSVQFWFVVLLVTMSAFMVNSFLSFSATNEFEIYHYGIGPTETRIVFIAINTWIVYFGTDQFFWLVPLACLLTGGGLVFNAWQIHNKLWRIDMDNKSSDRSS